MIVKFFHIFSFFHLFLFFNLLYILYYAQIIYLDFLAMFLFTLSIFNFIIVEDFFS